VVIYDSHDNKTYRIDTDDIEFSLPERCTERTGSTGG
jgi:hypothetical protein